MVTESWINKFRADLDILRKEQVSLDRKLAELAYKGRLKYPPGPEGDIAFHTLCVTSLEFDAKGARRFLVLASIGRITERQFKQVGGYMHVYKLDNMSSDQRNEFIDRAIAQNCKIEQLLKSEGKDKPRPEPSNDRSDLIDFAEFIVNSRTAPSGLKTRARKYVNTSARKLKVAA